MRKACVFWLLLLSVSGAILAGPHDIQPQTIVDDGAYQAYQRFFTEPSGALLTNLVANEVTGLRLTFSGPVASITAFGFFATASITKNEGGVVLITGSIPLGGMVNLEWPLEGPQITKAEWLEGSNAVGAIDVHSPVLRVAGTINPVTSWPVAVVRINLNALSSYDPDGRPLAKTEWLWSDGITQTGAAVTRGITNFNPANLITLDVTVTVTDAAGEETARTLSFVIGAEDD